MKKERDYYQDIKEIHSMMERSSKFSSLSGWAGIMAGFYALAGAFIAYSYLEFNPDSISISQTSARNLSPEIGHLALLAVTIFILATGTAVFFSWKKSIQRGENLWNPTSKSVLEHMLIPLVVGGFVILIFLFQDLIGLLAPLSLIFYGLALYNTSKFTFREIKILGFVEMTLGLLGCYFIEYGLLVWALGFGVAHVIYGVYLHLKYER